jgi:hypothetical protein
LVSDKSEIACLSDSHAAQLNWRKEDCWSVSPLQAARCATPYFSYTNSLCNIEKKKLNKLNWIDKILLIIGIIPLIWISLVLITYFKVALEIGSFPMYNNPDSGQFKLFLSNYSFWNYGLLFISQIGIVTVPILLILYRVFSNYSNILPKLTMKSILFGYSGYLILICFFLIRPLSEIVYWYLD